MGPQGLLLALCTERVGLPMETTHLFLGLGRRVFAISLTLPAMKENRNSVAGPRPLIPVRNRTLEKKHMSNPSNTLLEVEETLHAVIDNLIDSQKEFQMIGEKLEDPSLKLYFLEESLIRAEYRGDLESVLHHEGVHDIEESGSVSATLQRTWAELKSKLGGGDHALLETAEKAEVKAVEAYAKALDKTLPFPVRQLLSSQSADVQLFLDYIKAARVIGM